MDGGSTDDTERVLLVDDCDEGAVDAVRAANTTSMSSASIAMCDQTEPSLPAAAASKLSLQKNNQTLFRTEQNVQLETEPMNREGGQRELTLQHFVVPREMSAGVPSAADDRPKAGAMRRLAKTIAENADADGTIPSPVVAQVR